MTKHVHGLRTRMVGVSLTLIYHPCSYIVLTVRACKTASKKGLVHSMHKFLVHGPHRVTYRVE